MNSLLFLIWVCGRDKSWGDWIGCIRTEYIPSREIEKVKDKSMHSLKHVYA